MPPTHRPGGPSPGAQHQAGSCCSRTRCAREPGTSCPSPPLLVTQPPHRPCRREAGHRSSPAGSTGSQGRKQRSSGRHHSSCDGLMDRTSPAPQPSLPTRVGSSALPLPVGTDPLAEAELVALGAQGTGMPWTQGCPALARCPSGCVLRLPPPGKGQQPGTGQGPTTGLGVWGCQQRLWPCAG